MRKVHYLLDNVAVVVVAVKPNPPSIVVLFNDVDRFVEKPPNAGAELCAVVVALAPKFKPVDMLFGNMDGKKKVN